MSSFGAKIRDLRESKNISIKDMAERTGLSSSFISQLERDLVTPSIASLREIGKVLEVPIFHLIDEEVNGQVVKGNRRKKYSYPDSNITFELLSPDLNRKMEIILVTLGPNDSTNEKPASHDGEESGYCSKGSVEVILGSEKYFLETGDSIYFACSVPHLYRNIGQEDATIIISVTPPSF